MSKKIWFTVLLSSLVFPAFVLSYTSPGKPQGFVNDFASILSPETKSHLEQKLSALASQSTIEVVLLIVPTLGDESIETYSFKLFEDWGIGDEKKDNGVLFLVAPNDREVRIEVGYGLEGTLTDAQSNGIIQKIVIPQFKKGDMEKGIVDGIDALVSVVSGEVEYSTVVKEEKDINWVALVYPLFFFFIMFASVLGRSKSWWLGGVMGSVAGVVVGLIFGFIFIGIISIVGLGLLGLLFDFIVSKAYSKGKRDGGGPPWWIGGGGFGGHGGGGFGGFGGGLSGGGGASGRW